MATIRITALAALLGLLASCTGQAVARIVDVNGVNGGTPTGASIDTGLPCDVLDFVQQNCAQCHGVTPSGGSPMSLMTRDELCAPALTNSAKTNGQLAIDRMKHASPMPPGALLPTSAFAVLENWVSAGMPAGSCQSSGSDPYNTPVVCTSNQHWTRGNDGSSSMHPGDACIQCHSQGGEGPRYNIAGTVYPTAHEPSDCNGQSGVEVIITDAAGKTLTLTAGSAGNFYSRTALTLPYTAKVVSGSKVRAMSAAQTSGDCNSCHTEQGSSSAPGRIMAP